MRSQFIQIALSNLMENSFSEKVSTGATVKHINMVPNFELTVKTKK